MRNQRYKTYIYWGVTAIAVMAAVVALVFLFLKLNDVKAAFRLVGSILTPVIYGAVLAYLLTPVYNWIGEKTRAGVLRLIDNQRLANRAARAVGTAASLAVIFAVVVGLLRMLLPQLFESVRIVVESLPGNADNLYRWLSKLLEDNPDMEIKVLSFYDQAADMLQHYLTVELMPNLDKVISGVSSGLISVVVLLKNILIGLIVMVYLLNIKNTFSTQGKKIVYSLLPLKPANLLIEKIRFTHRVFGGFIIGKLLDSLIIGILCFIFLSLMNMPYVLLVSVIVGVTNVIPFFGPFIGAIPSAVLILMVSPIKTLYFIIFIVLLQQFDGNILGPKILGDSTGISSFWVLFSILLFGGLFGFVGMIIGVPTFAVFYNLFSEWISARLKKKDLSVVTQDYEDLEYIDEEKKTYIKR